MSAYNNDLLLKREILKKINESKTIIKQGEGTFWNWKYGSPVGAVVKHETKSLEIFSEKYNFSKDFLNMIEYIFNNIDENISTHWVFNLFKKIEVGENTDLKYAKIKKRLLVDEELGLLSKVVQNINCSVTRNIISFVSEKIKNNESFPINNLIESTLNPLVNENITQEDYQDIIDIFSQIQEKENNDIKWALCKIEPQNIMKVINEEVELTIF